MDSQSLGLELDALVDKLLESGRFSSRDEVLREGLRLLREQELDRAQFRDEMRRRIAEADAGHVKPAEEAFDELERYVRALARKNAA